MAFEYKMIQVPPNVTSTSKRAGQEAADYLQGIVNEQAREGWEFYRIDTLGVAVPQGCLGMGGHQVSQYYVVTFRRPV